MGEFLGNYRLRVDGNRISGTLPPGVTLNAAVHASFRPAPPGAPPSTPAKSDTSGGSRRAGASAMAGALLSGVTGLVLFLGS